jgi:hypothetical protein
VYSRETLLDFPLMLQHSTTLFARFERQSNGDTRK